MMRKRFLYPVITLALGVAPAQAAPGAITGIWARDDGGTRMAIAQCGANLCATNIWVKNPAGKERVGDELILTLTPHAEGLTGKAYDVRRKTTYRMTITLDGARMRTSGCVLLGMICKSAQWTRVAAH